MLEKTDLNEVWLLYTAHCSAVGWRGIKGSGWDMCTQSQYMHRMYYTEHNVHIVC